MAGRKVWAADEILAAADLQSYIQDQVVFVFNDASARTSGILAPTEGMVSYLKDTNLLYAFDGSAWVEVAPNVGTPGTYTKVTTDAKGRVSSGTTLSESDIPTLSIAKTSGLQTALDSKQASLGFTPVRQGGTDVIEISWRDNNSAAYTVNGFDQGKIVSTGRPNGFLQGGTSINVGSVTCSTIVSGVTYNTNVAYSSYRALWVNSDGTFGYTPSNKDSKQDIVNTAITVDDVLKLRTVDFLYKDDVAINGDHAVLRSGLIAEEVAKIPSLQKFVYKDDAGKIEGINYEHLSVALIPAIQDLAVRLDAVEQRLSELEK